MNSPEVYGTSSSDHVDICVLKYWDHPSIKSIGENISFVNSFIFSEITETNIKTSKLSTKKAAMFGKFPTKYLQESSDVCNLVLKDCVRYIFAHLFLSLNESPCQTRKNVFYFTSKTLFVLEKIKF